MTNFFMFMGFLYLAGQIIGFISLGSAGLATTSLSTAVDNDDVTLTVSNTSGFLASDYVILGNEHVCYSSTTATTFVVSERGCHDTDPEAHASGTRVYNETTGMINHMVGYNVLQSFSNDGYFIGIFKAPINAIKFLTHAFPKLILFDYPFFEGHAVWLKYFFFVSFGLGFVGTMIVRFVTRSG